MPALITGGHPAAAAARHTPSTPGVQRGAAGSSRGISEIEWQSAAWHVNRSADRTRSHHLGGELYGKLFAAIKGFRETLAKVSAQIQELSAESQRLAE
jgi:hypothetical protein